jgi:uncharacterized protein (TIGR04222 family)
MKPVAYSVLWSAIEQFPLDDPDAAIPFSRKLAAKQNWSPHFTERVIEEYRKFLLLCCISPTGASPSQIVDEAWHLHLTYTQSYWIDLCKNTLQKDIHHHPSRGGDDEDHKHRDWYKETLLLYQSVFESPPPNDIWPPPNDNLPAEPATGIRNEIIVLISLLLLLPFVTSAYQHHILFPFSLNGPQFLSFFPVLAITCIVCFAIWQHEKGRRLRQVVIDNYPHNATVFETAQFLFGKHRAIQTAIVDLVRRGCLQVLTNKTFLLGNKWQAVPGEEANPLVNGFMEETEPVVNYDMIACNWYKQEQATHPFFEMLHEFAFAEERLIARFNFLLVPFAVGVLRFFQGLANDKPVAYLFFQMLLYVIAVFFFRNFFSRRRMVFKQALELATRQNDVQLLYADEVVNNFGLQGEQAIYGFSDGLLLASIFAVYPIQNHASWSFPEISVGDGSGGSGGGCGSGGCGGGCGGGGCGGCGS